MKILLIGEYSNVHATLAKGLRRLGHEVTVASNGDFWKDYPRDIDLARRLGTSGTIDYLRRLLKALPTMRGYDIVQLINPLFLEVKAAWHFPLYRYLRRHNHRVVLCAFGMDYFWVNECIGRRHLRYSDFNFGNELRTNAEALAYRRDWMGTAKERLNRLIADDCDAIVAGLYEYMTCYEPHYPQKTSFIAYPIELPEAPAQEPHRPLRLFIGINRARSTYKGTDVMLRAAQRIEQEFPQQVRLQIAENVPFEQYQQMMNEADVLLDQLYSYTPAMNALAAMSKGIVCVGGGEPENYEILGETDLRPIVNVQPTEESVYEALRQLVQSPERVAELKKQSQEYIRKHHEYLHIARQYERLYAHIL